MARFRLKAGYDEKDLGKLILELAETSDREERTRLQREIGDMLDPGFTPDIEFVYDTDKTVHIVVPNLERKKYSDNDFANEAMGYIVLRGCGK